MGEPSSLGNIQSTDLLAAKYRIDRAADAAEASSRFQVFGLQVTPPRRGGC
jgi:hypothetical protein